MDTVALLATLARHSTSFIVMTHCGMLCIECVMNRSACPVKWISIIGYPRFMSGKLFVPVKSALWYTSTPGMSELLYPAADTSLQIVKWNLYAIRNVIVSFRQIQRFELCSLGFNFWWTTQIYIYLFLQFLPFGLGCAPFFCAQFGCSLWL